jgi:hypothetical protein
LFFAGDSPLGDRKSAGAFAGDSPLGDRKSAGAGASPGPGPLLGL